LVDLKESFWRLGAGLRSTHVDVNGEEFSARQIFPATLKCYRITFSDIVEDRLQITSHIGLFL
jgi:hypothetical protein